MGPGSSRKKKKESIGPAHWRWRRPDRRADSLLDPGPELQLEFERDLDLDLDLTSPYPISFSAAIR